MKIIPLHDRVLVKLDKAVEWTPGGIALPDVAQEESQTGLVVGVGPGRRDENGKLHFVSVKKGDRVLFRQNAGVEVDDDVLLLNENDLLGRIE